MDDARCHVCAGRAVSLATYHGIDRDNALEVSLFEGRAVVRCETCGHAFCLEPLPHDELTAYYGSFWGGERRMADAVRSAVVWAQDRLRPRRGSRSHDQLDFPPLQAWLADRDGGLATLEVGAGPAEFSRALRGRTGGAVIEPGRQFDVLYRLSGLTKLAGTLEDAVVTDSFDLVNASHVIEHFVDAHAAIDKLREMLRPGGALLVEVPNCEQPYWERRLYPDPPHVQFFTPESLRRLLTAHGFDDVQVSTGGAPLEREVGYFRPDSPAVMSRDEIDRLGAERAERAAALPPASNEYADYGREFIRALAT